ncbi:MAG: DUF5058 family protein [Oscillospiraceae bacterium]|jgi:hypothetical protein|nr:DUF5058 family protein [Oscillospiraceae bacterium]
MADFRQSTFMYLLGGAVVAFVIAQALFFMRKAYKHGVAIGMSKDTLRRAIGSSALFTIAPSLAIAATVLALSKSLGIVMPWIRLSVIGNITYETTAAQAAADGVGLAGGLSQAVTDPSAFSAIAWVMTIGSVFPLILLPLFLKKIQKKIGSTATKNQVWTDVMSSAAFIGLIAAFLARSIAGQGGAEIRGDGAGVLSVITLVAAVGSLLLLEWLVKRFKLKWLQPFTMPVSMFFAMGMAVLFAREILPEDIAFLEWRG